MLAWTVVPEWRGQDAVIVGGGSSLKLFDFSRLIGQNTIGCNDAFRLGKDIISVCLFGDASWFHKNKWELEKFENRVLTCSPHLEHLKVPWMYYVRRLKRGLFPPPQVGWNYSTGACAVNVAINLGAKRIFLLGFDMGVGENGKTHWHHYRAKAIEPSAYSRFIRGFQAVAVSAESRYPMVQILNVTDGSSRLPFFSRVSFKDFNQLIRPEGRKVEV